MTFRRLSAKRQQLESRHKTTRTARKHAMAEASRRCLLLLCALAVCGGSMANAEEQLCLFASPPVAPGHWSGSFGAARQAAGRQRTSPAPLRCVSLVFQPTARLDGGFDASACTLQLFDFMCEPDTPATSAFPYVPGGCGRVTSGGERADAASRLPGTSPDCIPRVCAEVCAHPDSPKAFCARCERAGHARDAKLSVWQGVPFFFAAIYNECLATLSSLACPWGAVCGLCYDHKNHPPRNCPPPPPPPFTSPPPPLLGAPTPPPPPAGSTCGATAPKSCKGIPCSGKTTCTSSTPQCCCGADCATFGDCCPDRVPCCGARMGVGSEEGARGMACGMPAPGRSCRGVPCSGNTVCNQPQPGGCCCDVLCPIIGDCCADRETCCGTELSMPRIGQAAERDANAGTSSAYVTGRITAAGVDVAHGVNVRTGLPLLMPRPADVAQRRIG